MNEPILEHLIQAQESLAESTNLIQQILMGGDITDDTYIAAEESAKRARVALSRALMLRVMETPTATTPDGDRVVAVVELDLEGGLIKVKTKTPGVRLVIRDYDVEEDRELWEEGIVLPGSVVAGDDEEPHYRQDMAATVAIKDYELPS